MNDFTSRTGVAPATLERLARADAFASLKLDRRAALWQTLAQEKRDEARPLFRDCDAQEPAVRLPALSAQDDVSADYRTAGLSLKNHPVAFFRERLDQLQVTPAVRLADHEDGSWLRVAGLVLVRQRPGTAKGITFVTIEDETGSANLIIRMDVWERFYQIARTTPGYIAHGRLQKHKGILHVLVSRLENLNESLKAMHLKTRDFH